VAILYCFVNKEVSLLVCSTTTRLSNPGFSPAITLITSAFASVLPSGAVRNPEEVEALEAREEHRGGVPPHLQQYPQHQDSEPVEPRLPTASSRQDLLPGLQPRGDAHACGRMPQRGGRQSGGVSVRLTPSRGNHQQLPPTGGHQPHGQGAVLRGSARERGERPVKGAGEKKWKRRVGGP